MAPPTSPLAEAAVALVAGLLLGHVPGCGLLAAPLLLLDAGARRWRAAARGLLLGLLLAPATAHDPTAHDATAAARREPPRAAALRGRVRTVEPPHAGGLSFVLAAHAALDGARAVAYRAVVQVEVERAHGLLLAPGDEVEALLELRPPPAPGNPGERDARPWYARRGIDLLGRAPHARAVRRLCTSTGIGAGLARARAVAARALDRALSPADAGLARGLLLGDREALSAADRDAFRAAGQTHLVAVSGQHVVLVLAAVLLLAAAAGLSRRTAAALGIVAVALYVPFAGAAPSAVRSGLAAALWLLARLLGRGARASATLAAAALAMLFVSPEDLADPGFTLSFAAVLGIERLAPRFLAAWAPRPLAIPGRPTPRRPRLRQALAVALAAWLAGAPLALHAFGQVCLASAPLSLLTVPLAALLLGLSALLAACEALGLPAAPPAWAFGTIADLLREVLGWPALAGLENVTVPPPGDAWLAASLALLVLAATGPRRALRWTLLGVGALGLFALTPRPPAPPPRPELHLFDLGPAAAALLRTPAGGSALLLAGPRPIPPRAQDTLTRALTHLGAQRPALLLLAGVAGERAAPPAPALRLPEVAPPPLASALAVACRAWARQGRGAVVLEVGAEGRLTLRAPGRPAATRGYDAPRMTPLALPTLLAFAAVLAAFAAACVRPLAWLRPGGALGAWALGTAVAATLGWAGFAALFAPFVVGTLLGRLPGAARDRGRTLKQVVANGLPALLGAGLAALGRAEEGAAFLLGGLACLGADTCATEIGTRYGGPPHSLLTGRPLARGESGGVTRAGLLASLAGALLAPGAWAALESASPSAVGWLAAAGVAGALIDSLLGATLQFRGRHPGTGEVTEAVCVAGAPTARVSGWRWLDNDAVNLVAGLAAGVLALLLLRLA